MPISVVGARLAALADEQGVRQFVNEYGKSAGLASCSDVIERHCGENTKRPSGQRSVSLPLVECWKTDDRELTAATEGFLECQKATVYDAISGSRHRVLIKTRTDRYPLRPVSPADRFS